MKILGLDVGVKRIGVAKVDTSTKIAIPVCTVEVDGTEFEKIAKLANLNNTKFFVLGLPRSNEGNETKQSEYARNFGKILVKKIPGAKIRFQDESLTSVEAENRLKARKKNWEKGEIDAEAASIILQDFIETFNPESIKSESIAPEPSEEKPATKKSTPKKQNIFKKKMKIPLSKKIITLLVSILIVAGLCGGLIFWYFDSLTPVVKNCDDNRCPETEFVIHEGASIDAIVDDLNRAGLIKSQFFFKVNVKLSYGDKALKSGKYILTKGMSASEITEKFINGASDSNVFTFTILPGENIFDVKKKLMNIGYSSEAIDAALSKNYDNPVLKDKKGDTIEGYLFGETYEFFNDDSVETIIERFIGGMEAAIEDNNLVEKFAAKGLTLYEGITLASIVQKEAKTADQPTVAQVFFKRLAEGIPLGSDVTVTYALDKQNPNRNRDDTAVGDAINVDSPYNTRKNTGLPVGPISNPSLSALLAVAEPSDTDYYYFLTGDDGKMYYSYTEEEHNQNARLYCQVLCNVSL